jgi:hypothetical protein
LTAARSYDHVSFGIRVVALRLCDDMERLRLDTIRIGPFVTRARTRESYQMDFEETPAQ